MELSHTGIDTFVVSAFQREGLPFGKDIINPYIKDYPYLEIRPSVTKLHSSERSCQDELEWLSKVQALFGSGWLSWRSDPETQKISFESCTF